MKPANWSDKDGRYVWFFNFSGRIKGTKKGFNLSVDKSHAAGTVRTVLQIGSRARDPDHKVFIALGKAEWNTETWHKLDATWDSTHLAIYVDGRLSNRQEMPNIAMPELERARIVLAQQYTGPDIHVRSFKDRIYLDEVEVYSTVHPPGRILERYLADRPDVSSELPVPEVIVPRGALAIGDGPSWPKASQVPILVNIRNAFPHTRRSSAAISYTDEHLFVGLSTESPKAPIADATERDGKVWFDDAFEVFLLPGETPTPHFFQFIVNSRGTLLDTRGRKIVWNGPGIRVFPKVDKHRWWAVLKIPFADLETAPPKPGDVWRANFCRNWHRPRPAHPIYTTWSYGGPSYLSRPDRFGRIRFGQREAAGLKIEKGLTNGNLNVTATSTLPSKASVNVRAKDAVRFTQTRQVSENDKAEFHHRIQKARLGHLKARVEDTAGKLLQSYEVRFLIKQPIAVTWIPDVPNKRLQLDMDLKNLNEEWRTDIRKGSTKLSLSTKGQNSGVTVSLNGLLATASLPFEFTQGTQSIVFRLESPGREPFTVEESIEIPALDWVGSAVGVTDNVLEPWTPLELDQGSVLCWGRRYRFDGPFLSSVESQKKEMLRDGIRMTLKTEGRSAILKTSAGTETKLKRASRLERSGTAIFEGTSLQAEWESWLEYDGLVVSTITLVPPKGGIEIQTLDLNIPLVPGLKYIRGARKSPNRMDWNGREWRSHFEPFIWLTDEDRGFLYFCESEANWIYARGEQVTVVRGGEDAGIRLRLITRPTRLSKPVRYQFGFQATPVKPLMTGWREMNFGPGLPIKHQTHQPWMNGYTDKNGLWTAPRPDVITKFDIERHNKGVLTFFYATTSCTPNNHPTYHLFRKLWNSPYPAQFGPYQNKESRFRPATSPYHLVPVCPGAPTFVDYELWLAKRFHEQTGAMAFYTDTDGIWPCENRSHGCGFEDVFGKKGVSYTILNKREFSKRIAALCRQFKRDGERGYWMTHCHSKLVPPVHCFADFFWPGEEYTHRLYGNRWYYTDTMDELDWRAQLNSNVAGLPHIFLPEFKRGTKDPTDINQPQPTESLLAMCAVNDINTSAAYCHLPTMIDWWSLRKKLNLNSGKFIAYWREDCPAKAINKKARASVYLWPKRAAVALANISPQKQSVKCKLDLEKMGLAAKVKAVDMRSGKSLEIKDGVIETPIAARSFTYVSLGL
ncbi:MAG: DUF6067 family protein [Planctomycetota bacterium]|nr:DUF6067 family protein [Planctomycetota bacterium]